MASLQKKPLQGMETTPEDFPSMPLLIYPNLGCPQIISYQEAGPHVFEGIFIAESGQSQADIGAILANRIVLYLLSPQDGSTIAHRRGPIQVIIETLERWPALPFPHPRYASDGLFNYPRPDVLEVKAFGNRNAFYYARLAFELAEEYQEELNTCPFLLFDIVFEARTGLKRVNFHALCVSPKDWQDLTFVHATDLHCAQRNDNFLPVIREQLSANPETHVQEEHEDDFDREIKDIPLEDRFLNINDNLRRFCKVVSKRARAGDVDFVVLTGDLVDFVVLASGGASPFNYNFHNTNWETLRDILLGVNYEGQEPADECGELLVPCFTIVGNHDYRLWHYSISWGFLYRFLGLTGYEAFQYYDPLPANPIGALKHSDKALMGYFQEFNPWLDYHLIFGNNHFLFLDTKWDSWVDFRDLLIGSPSLAGLLRSQFQWVQMQAKSVQPGQNLFIFTHAPFLNPTNKVKGWEMVKEFFQGDKYRGMDDLKENAQPNAPLKDRRIDMQMTLKSGCISHFWVDMLEFCLTHATLVLSGHTHNKLEFRITPAAARSNVVAHFPFTLKKISTPAAVFYDDYSALAENPEWIAARVPFLVQTPALGPNNFRRNQRAGAFRLVTIRGGKLEGFPIESLFS